MHVPAMFTEIHCSHMHHKMTQLEQLHVWTTSCLHPYTSHSWIPVSSEELKWCADTIAIIKCKKLECIPKRHRWMSGCQKCLVFVHEECTSSVTWKWKISLMGLQCEFISVQSTT
jgi:hypothetical protein